MLAVKRLLARISAARSRIKHQAASAIVDLLLRRTCGPAAPRPSMPTPHGCGKLRVQ
jgi:hypothetical protein